MIAYYYRKGSLDGRSLDVSLPALQKYDIVYTDVADRFNEQVELQSMIKNLVLQNIHKVVCESLTELSNCAWTQLLNLLRTITDHAELVIVDYPKLDVGMLVKQLDEWESAKREERQKLIASRSLVVGRPRKSINVTEALRLREEEHLTFKDIADKLNTNVAMVYREMPKHLKGRLDKGLRMRSRERVRRLEEIEK